ncbi:MAG: hypothetical protein WC511_02970 [Candidatus Pacearchaeota archaeon]
MDEVATMTQILPEMANMSFWILTKMWIFSNFGTFLSMIVFSILVPIFSPIVVYLTMWVKSSFDQKVFNTALSNTKELVKLTVAESNQKFITKYPGANNVPQDVKEKAFKTAFDKIMVFMPSLDKQVILARHSDLNSFITSLIEAEVLLQAQFTDFDKVS